MKSRFSLMTPIVVILSVFAGNLPLWAQPPGYYDSAEGLLGAELQTALHQIIDNHTVLTYAYLWTAFYTTDDKPNGMVWDIYSDIPGGDPPYEYQFGVDQAGSASGEGEGYNREHSFPRSWFGGEVLPMNTDINMIYPTDVYVNSMRGSYAYGEVASPSWTSLNGSRRGSCSTPGYSGTAFEPRDDFKGDLARTYFYTATRYLGEDGAWPGGPMSNGAVLLPWAVEMLLAWHEADPVSQKEIDRNTAVWALQQNRNPFIDEPDYAPAIYDPEFQWEAVPLAPITDLTLEIVSGGVLLTWSAPTEDVNGNSPVVIEGYEIHHSTVPHFTPSPATLLDTITWENYWYLVDFSGTLSGFYVVVGLGHGV